MNRVVLVNAPRVTHAQERRPGDKTRSGSDRIADRIGATTGRCTWEPLLKDRCRLGITSIRAVFADEMYSIKSENEVGFFSLKRKKNLNKQLRTACRNIKQEELNNSEELKAISIKKQTGEI